MALLCSRGPTSSSRTRACSCRLPKVEPWTNLRWRRSALECRRSGMRQGMANSDGKSDETRIQPNDDEARAEGSAAPEEPGKPPIPPDTGVVPEAEPRPNRLAQLARQFSRPVEASREAKSGERTRGPVILAGTTIACLFLFFGLFTTDSESTLKERRTAPNLGRPEAAAQAEGP